MAGIDAFNENRKRCVMASHIKVLDESMSAYRPQITKTGNLPNITCLLRKPEPLGTEFKCVSCSVTGILLHLEIQRGARGMATVKYADKYKATAATVVRLAEATMRTSNPTTNPNESLPLPPQIFLGDSWFSSIQAAAEVCRRNAHYIGIVKTGFATFPKLFLEEKMKEWPGGSHLVMESQHPDGFQLLAIGYKYNSKKVVSFVATKGCGDTEAGIPYEARWKDDNGNTVVRDVKRPEIVSKYFTKCNSIDVHNKNRQYDLKLEKHWKSNCGHF